MKSNCGSDGLLLPTPEPPQMEEASTGVIAGRYVSVYNNNQCLLLDLPVEVESVLIRYLGFREITRLAKVCRYLRDFIKEDKALEKAWIRRFPSPQKY
ncbi:F-box protein, partial [Endozoicomonas sp. SESOKO3]|uniref:F-box protein n=1 Tax=Endozoicomonas sp. SESOKO3 TaxID=2828744 RepID=UPI002147678A